MENNEKTLNGPSPNNIEVINSNKSHGIVFLTKLK